MKKDGCKKRKKKGLKKDKKSGWKSALKGWKLRWKGAANQEKSWLQNNEEYDSQTKEMMAANKKDK